MANIRKIFTISLDILVATAYFTFITPRPLNTPERFYLSIGDKKQIIKDMFYKKIPAILKYNPTYKPLIKLAIQSGHKEQDIVDFIIDGLCESASGLYDRAFEAKSVGNKGSFEAYRDHAKEKMYLVGILKTKGLDAYLKELH